jgi:hypothetical protein
MERPTCKTCPYWLIEDDDCNPITLEECLKLPGDTGPDDWYFECKRYPRKETDEIYKHGGDFCGEHPDFPAFIASLKPAESSGNSVLDNLLKTVEKY